MGTNLRAVGPDEGSEGSDEGSEKKAEKKPETILEAADGSRRDVLVMMRKKIAAVLDGDVAAHAIARLVSELKQLDEDIRDLDARATEESGDDDEGGGFDSEWEAV